MHTMSIDTTALAGPALRLHLLELFIGNTDMPELALPLAQAAERWIVTAGEIGDIEVGAEGEASGMPPSGGDLCAEISSLMATSASAPTTQIGATDVEGLAALVDEVSRRRAADESEKPASSRLWTAEEELRLERLVASGMSYADIAVALDRPQQGVYNRASEAGITKRWPRAAKGRLRHHPYPLDAPWPPSAEQLLPVVPDTRKAQMLALMEQGLTAKEIADTLGVSTSSVSARATQWRVTPMWRAARDQRQAQVQEPAPAAPQAAPDIAPVEASVPADEVEPQGVELPPPEVSLKPLDEAVSTDDQVAAALVVDKPGFPVQPRSLAEVETTAEPPRHTAAPLVTMEPEQPARAPRRFIGANRKVAKHLPGDVQAEKLAERALIEAALDRGMVKITREVLPAHHPGGSVPLDIVITYLRNDDVIVNINKGLWLVNGAESLSAKQLLERANKRRKRHRLEPFELEK